MSRMRSITIGTLSAVATALTLTVSTPALSPVMAKGKHHKTYKHKNSQPSLRSFRYDSYRHYGSRNRRSHIGFPFRGTYGNSISNSASTGNVEQSGNYGNSVTVNEGPRAPLGLQLTGTFMKQRSPAKVLKVSNDLKSLGEERAERRRDRFDAEGDTRVFNFYRENEAFDVRFPSVVYLKSD